jgi:hypothetical protein
MSAASLLRQRYGSARLDGPARSNRRGRGRALQCRRQRKAGRRRQRSVSTSGAGFGHPDGETVARIMTLPSRATKTLFFNYTEATITKNYQKKKGRAPEWTSGRIAREHRCVLQFPQDDTHGLVIEL